MKPPASNLDALRHRILEGVLLRLAKRPNASDFVVRGGILMRQWFRPYRRPAEDLDLVAAFPFDVADATRRFFPVLSETVADGVRYDLDRVRGEGIWLLSGSPGVRMFVAGVADGCEIEFNVDITFGPAPRPAAVLTALPTACGEVAQVWACRPETVTGHKMQALWHRGRQGWRPKDLHDLRLLLTLVPMDAAKLREAIDAYLDDVGGSLEGGRELFGPGSWWGMKMVSARWQDFARGAVGLEVPRELGPVVAEVANRLAPILEGDS